MRPIGGGRASIIAPNIGSEGTIILGRDSPDSTGSPGIPGTPASPGSPGSPGSGGKEEGSAILLVSEHPPFVPFTPLFTKRKKQ